VLALKRLGNLTTQKIVESFLKMRRSPQKVWNLAGASCFSVAEYCRPIWQGAAHTNLVDRQVHCAMRLISGTVRSSPAGFG